MKPLIFSSVSVAGTSLVPAGIFLSLRLYQNPQWSSRERAAGCAFTPEFPHFCIIDCALHLMWVCDHGKDGLGRQSSEVFFFFVAHLGEDFVQSALPLLPLAKLRQRKLGMLGMFQTCFVPCCHLPFPRPLLKYNRLLLVLYSVMIHVIIGHQRWRVPSKNRWTILKKKNIANKIQHLSRPQTMNMGVPIQVQIPYVS